MAHAHRLDRLEQLTWARARAYFDAMPEAELLAWIDARVGVPMRDAMLAYLDQCSAEELAALAQPPGPANPAQQRWQTAYAAWCALYPFEPEEARP